jgi:ribosome-binding factor A
VANERTIARLEARIRERAAHAVEFELSDPRSAFITVTRVDLTRDLSRCKVYYSVLGSPAEQRRVQRMLDDAAGFVQRKIADYLSLRRVPHVSWHYDESIEELDRMDRLIEGAMESDREVNPDAHGGDDTA